MSKFSSFLVSLAAAILFSSTTDAIANGNITGTYSFYQTCKGLTRPSWDACKASVAKITSDNVVRGTLYVGNTTTNGLNTKHKLAYRLDSLKPKQSNFSGNSHFYKNGKIDSKEPNRGKVTHGPLIGQINFWEPTRENKWVYTFSLYKTGSSSSVTIPKSEPKKKTRRKVNTDGLLNILTGLANVAIAIDNGKHGKNTPTIGSGSRTTPTGTTSGQNRAPVVSSTGFENLGYCVKSTKKSWNTVTFENQCPKGVGAYIAWCRTTNESPHHMKRCSGGGLGQYQHKLWLGPPGSVTGVSVSVGVVKTQGYVGIRWIAYRNNK